MSKLPPSSNPELLSANVECVRARIRAAAERSGRDAAEVTLVAVTKTVPAEIVRLLAGTGIRDLGENRVPEALGKAPAVGSGFRWHLIGHLQRNKARRALPLFSLLHSLDSLRLLEHLDRIAGESEGTVVKALLQINVSGEDQKYGIGPAEVRGFLSVANGFRHVEIEGLMGMAPFVADPEEARPSFRRLARIQHDANASGWYRVALARLSMGMSNDFEVAVEEGATMVRVGTALFRGLAPAGDRTGGSEGL